MDLKYIINEIERERRKILFANLCEKGMNNHDYVIRRGTIYSIIYLDFNPDKFLELLHIGTSDNSPGSKVIRGYNHIRPLHEFTGRGDRPYDEYTFGSVSGIAFTYLKKILRVSNDMNTHRWLFDGIKPNDYSEIKNSIAKAKEDIYLSGNLVALWPTRFLELYEGGLNDKDEEIREKTASKLRYLAATIDDEVLVPIEDEGYDFIKTYLDSKYIKDKSKEEIIAEIKKLAQNPNINYSKLKLLVKLGEAINLEEMIELSMIEVADYLILRKIGDGAIKKAYIARNIHSGDESVLLMIDPDSKGFKHYKNMYKDLTDEELRQKIYSNEFSGIKLRNLEDTRFISIVSPPIKGRKSDGQEVYFLETIEYEQTLEDKLKNKIDEKTAFKYFYQIITALNNCHKEGIVHKDLKPENIGITRKDNILLSDFGCTSIFSEVSDSRYQYPLDLRPPELAYDEEYWKQEGIKWQSDLFTPEANVWSVGVILYRMVTGKHLFERPRHRAEIGSEEYHMQNEEVYKKIRAFSFRNVRGQLTQGIIKKEITIVYCEALLSICLKVNPNERKGSLVECIDFMKNSSILGSSVFGISE